MTLLRVFCPFRGPKIIFEHMFLYIFCLSLQYESNEGSLNMFCQSWKFSPLGARHPPKRGFQGSQNLNPAIFALKCPQRYKIKDKINFNAKIEPTQETLRIWNITLFRGFCPFWSPKINFRAYVTLHFLFVSSIRI